MKRFLTVLMALTMAICITPLTAFAAESVAEKNAAIARKEAEIEAKYGINIEYPTDSNGLAIVTQNSLITLDDSLNNVTAGVVRQVSSYYAEKNGKKLTFSYVRDPSYGSGNEVVLAGFDSERSLIELYIPRSNTGTLATGENPITIVHEFGHAFHFMYTDKYGMDKMRSEWTAYNGGAAYKPANIVDNPNTKVFVTGYAATMFEEDVAETFAHVFVRNQAGQGFSNLLTSNGAQTGLGKKVAYVEKMLTAYLQDTATAVANYRRIYSTPVSVNYQGMRLSGEHLQFMGYPQPRYVLGGTLSGLGRERSEAIWMRSIGGWYVKDTAGDELIIFPGGWWAEVGPNFTAPTAA